MDKVVACGAIDPSSTLGRRTGIIHFWRGAGVDELVALEKR